MKIGNLQSSEHAYIDSPLLFEQGKPKHFSTSAQSRCADRRSETSFFSAFYKYRKIFTPLLLRHSKVFNVAQRRFSSQVYRHMKIFLIIVA